MSEDEGKQHEPEPESPEVPSRPVRYDIMKDETVFVTQEDWDRLERRAWMAHMKPEGMPCGENPMVPMSLVGLACYPNRMRVGEVFVAEALEIEPVYDSGGNPIMTMSWEAGMATQVPYYPSTPKTQWVIPCSFSAVFAQEIVHRWNSYIKKQGSE